MKRREFREQILQRLPNARFATVMHDGQKGVEAKITLMLPFWLGQSRKYDRETLKAFIVEYVTDAALCEVCRWIPADEEAMDAEYAAADAAAAIPPATPPS